MGRETRIGLLVSLGFVVVFGLVLAELTGLESGGPAAGPSAAVTGSDYSHAVPIEDLRIPAVRTERAAPVRPAPAAGGPQVDAARRELRSQRVEPVAEAPRPAERQYTVRSNDTLIGIARKVYGPTHGNEYRRILEANRSRLSSATSLKPGQTLVIPALPGAAPRPAADAAAPTGAAPVVRSAAPSGAPAAAMTRSESRTESSGWTYTIRGNETLQEIAVLYYGDDSGAAVQKIINANPLLEGLSRYPVGMNIVIPR
ncbi:MAG: LysM peptidoglycan-binding domain-containing protein [Planctomycetaceae bacterium]|nr:LysM peptidoglycan-binding domain-containing protein [Planctomycetaceae bacterium]